jgi:regulator of nucleoside diphosphate kinase
MKTRTIYITEADMKKLRSLVETVKDPRTDVKLLEQELDHAVVVEPTEIPVDVITMNSRARVRNAKTGEEMIFTLVFPDLADIEQSRMSVLAPLGTAILGQRVGDEFEWEVPAGAVKLQVQEVVYQPEAAGHYHL